MSLRSAILASVGMLILGPACTRREASAQTPMGAPLKVRLEKVISSRAVSPGDSIEARLEEDLELDDKTTVPAGAKAIVRVIDSQPGIENGGPASMLLKVTQLRRNLTDEVQINTVGLQQQAQEIAAGSILTFRLSGSNTGTPAPSKLVR